MEENHKDGRKSKDGTHEQRQVKITIKRTICKRNSKKVIIQAKQI